ncbi:preprotein translocase subunit SecA [Candidatus Dojkabacteria bacterium HGW-Dojkabacteria-1]|uniref:Protein translocase subunit SecA n=1 Tax=Candidatus Dojkabacteria bacterium HGW-Dojkabacteria-1 TaxID=2013761 RepID=A0A2N2F3C2_9BACT|nr:MAG: preprotein translocase subunit SecA [Candidatus Dojkabacteria bacterium HGW-Dojkabacteria-1]
MIKLLEGLFDSNEKQLKKIQLIVNEINSLEEEMSKLSDEKLKKKTEEFRKILNVDLEQSRKDFYELSREELKKILDEEKKVLREILPQAFAVVREASKRVANHRHFDVQAMAGYVLFDNKVAELFTGEGKTLAANMPLYLYALTGRGAHLVTVNDYLARRDAEWNGHILNSLGMTVAAINSGTQYRYITDEEVLKLKGDEGKELIEQREKKAKEAGRLKYDHMSGVNLIECSKKEAYDCDVVYGTNNEYGFDYLRDNMVASLAERVQGPRYFAIVDEADSILIDEARTPLIISTSAEASNEMYKQFANLAKSLQKEKHYTVDEKSNSVSLNDEGIDAVEKLLKVKNVYENAQLAYHLDNALKAKELYKLDDEYMIKDGEVLIVDEFTGRALPGRRYSEGLHQAIEAKEGVEVKRESRTMATITLQNYFRLYSYLSGMTGTALTEAEEFASIYNLDTIVVPTNRPVVRKDYNDVVYRTMMGKFEAIVEDIKEHNAKGQPILVGTTSVEKSEALSMMLSKEGIAHEVLNAKHHEREAKIVSEAGQKGAVTIATNMAGRGTDIALGEGVKEAGGLYIIGSERHESRRIDNQLRGRAGRQGDPGESKFFVSFEDELMRLFGGERMQAVMTQAGLEDDMPISMGILGKTIENAQKKVEAHNYDIRKRLVEYDDVLNKQRNIIYDLRAKVLEISSERKETEEISLEKDIKYTTNLDIENLQDILDGFAVTKKDTWDIQQLEGLKFKLNPLDISILKKLLEYIDMLVQAQLEDDMEIDNIEERNLYIQVKNLLTEEIFEKGVKDLSFKNSIEFFRSLEGKSITDISKELKRLIFVSYIEHIYSIGVEPMRELSKVLILQGIDRYWMEHLDNMQDLREGISLRNLAQRDPLVEYKNEGFRLFDSMLRSIDENTVSRFFKVRVVRNQSPLQAPIQTEKEEVRSLTDNRPGNVSKQQTVKRSKKVGRNDPCPCGSGKKYKKCHYPEFE